ncbi:MAG: C1 family peptidase [Cyanobacteriota bacterium]
MELTLELVKGFNDDFNKDDSHVLAMNAVSRVELQDLAINRDLLKKMDFSFSHELDVAPEATAQQKVGVCWMFAAFNLLRYLTQQKINVKTFEYSGPYLMFWDKFEKANYFLEKMVELRNHDYDDRTVKQFLSNPIPDGGDWYMFVNLVKKYGIMPASSMQHSSYSKESTKHNEIMSSKLRKCASIIRKMHEDGSSLEEIQKKRAEFVEDIYKILVICFGNPPEKFDWSYKNEDKEFFREKDITPHDFFEKYVGINLDDYVSVWSSPMKDTPYNKLFTVEHTRKMVGGERHLSLNVTFEEFETYLMMTLKDNEPCLFSCDVGRDSLRKEGFLLKGIYNYDLIFKTNFDLEKAQRLEIGETSMTHCMLIVGMDLDGDKPLKWKVENSWGADVGKKGYFVMSDEWFNDNVYQLIINKKHLPAEKLEILKQDPILLPVWHPLN